MTLTTLEADFDGVAIRVVQDDRTVSVHLKEADRKIHMRLQQRDALVLINALTNAIINYRAVQQGTLDLDKPPSPEKGSQA